MQPTEPTTTTEQSAAPATASEQASPKADAEPGRSWIDKLLGRAPRQADPDPQVSQAQEEPTQEPVETTKVFSEDEFQRLVQAETDRRESKRQRDQQEAERRRLRKEDPYAYAEQDEQREAQQQSAAAFGNQIATVAGSIDRAVLDPVLERVPERLRGKLFDDPNAGVGLDGRKALVTKALDQLEKEWKAAGRAEAADKLLDDPTHQKKVLARVRGEPDFEEPDNVQGSPTRHSRDVNAILRQSIGL